MRSTLFAALLLAWAAASCTPAAQSFVAAQKEEKPTTKGETKEVEEERIDVPSNIAGSYLMCSLRKDATATDVSSEYGCRLNEEGTTNKLDLSAYESRIQWKSNLLQSLTIDAKPVNSVWHALYRLSAADLPTLRDLVARLKIEVQWTATDGTPLTTLQDSKVIEVLQPATAAGDTSAPILQGKGLDPNDPGTL